MTDLQEPANFTTHDLGCCCRLQSGLLPQALSWDDDTFETAWLLHPEVKNRIMIHGKPVETPRFQQAYGVAYHYSGQTNRALPVPELLDPLLAWARATIDDGLNGILLNWYEGAGHYIGRHRDSTKDMVPGAPIVTVSFGETRTFRLTRAEKRGKTWVVVETRDFPALHGTVFVMPYETNEVWKHGVPKAARYTGRRISVTFRAFEL